MIIEKKETLRSILESTDGVHLTAYLVNRGDLVDLKQQLNEIISEAGEYLSTALENEEIKKFLEPIESLLYDGRIFNSIKCNIGLFRTKDYFRVLSVPILLERQCHVANSFHIKPLLRWLQGDQDYLFLGIQDNDLHLYFGNQNTFKLIKSLSLAESVKKQNLLLLDDLIAQLTHFSQPKLFMAGKPPQLKEIRNQIKYKNLIKTSIADQFKIDQIGFYKQRLIQITRDDSRRSLEKSLVEFRFAEDENKATKNIFHIAKAVVQGKVRKLIVTDELNIFGKIDPKSGGISIHPFDLDHEDDCILDDLAQLVLNQGGEVVIAHVNEIPSGRPVLAILNDDEKNTKHKRIYRLNDLDV
ncbi:MAG: hypothetical protein ACK4VO_11225 [Pseudobdellovibrio sp.]